MQILKRANSLQAPELISLLTNIQRVLPIGIIIAVLVYELLCEFLLAASITSIVRFVVELAIFGGLGAVVTWLTLGWIRQNAEREREVMQRDAAERERIQKEIYELNRHLENLVAQRTQALSQANEGLRHNQRELEKANAELKQLDALKSEFVSLVSHELRAPLSNISGALQLLLGTENDAFTPNQREMLALADEQVERLTRLVKGILNVSRIEAGQIDLSCEAFDILVMIDHALKQWRACDPEHDWRGPTVSNLPSVWGDRDRVEEVLTNLLDNAFKYCEVGTTVRVDAQVAEDKMIVSVTDWGKGIPREELEKIFNRFHRVERGDARQTYGYGLGLYISRKLIETMGGMLWVESEVGQGSKFYFSLPLAGQANK